MVDFHEFDTLAKVYDWFPSGTHARAVRRAVGGHRGVALDLAGGTGKSTVRMHRDQDRVLVVDASQAMLVQNRTKGRPTDPVRGLAGRLPLPDDSVDVVTCTEAFHHFGGDQEATVAEVARVLRPDGVFVVEEMDPTRPIGRLVVKGHKMEPLTGQADAGAEPLRFHTPETLTVMLKRAFDDVHTSKASWMTFVAVARRPRD